MEKFFDNFPLLFVISAAPFLIVSIYLSHKLITGKELNWKVVRLPVVFTFLSYIPSGILLGFMFASTAPEYYLIASLVVWWPLISLVWALIGTASTMASVCIKHFARRQELRW